MEVGFSCAFLATPNAGRRSGETPYLDGGVSIMAGDRQREATGTEAGGIWSKLPPSARCRLTRCARRSLCTRSSEVRAECSASCR